MTSSEAERMKPVLSICVPSYRRPGGLFLLLGALDAQEFGEAPPEIRIVVVDNDEAESAREVIDDARSWLRHPIHYRVEKRVGIPQARNAALAAALSSDWIAFIDDDEVPEPGWLDALLRTQRVTGADVVTGPSLPRFIEPPPEWIIASGLFEPLRHATGAPVATAYTNNVLARGSALRALDTFFDERFTLGVGEDAELFARVAAAGGRIVWADDAIVYENVPPARATLRWMLARGYRDGAATAASAPHGPLRTAAGAASCIARGLAAAAFGALHGRARVVRGLRLAAFGLGCAASLCGVR
jgi:succinoglycan biosynthesis protein ExoM